MKNKNKHTLCILLSVLLIASNTLDGQPLASWDFNGTDLDNLDPNNQYTLAAGTTETEISEATLTLGPGVRPATATGQYGFKIATADSQTSLAGAIANGHYIELTLNAANGTLLNLSSLEFNGQSGPTGADNVALLSSIGGFTETAAIVTRNPVAGVTGGLDTDNSGFGGPIDLSSTEFQNIASITFRLYGWNSSGSTGATYFRNLSGNDLVIQGQAIVPEPATAAVLSGSLSLLAVLAVRHWQASLGRQR